MVITRPATNPATLSPANAAATFGNSVIILAIVLACVSMNPARDISAFDTTLHTSAKLVRLVSEPN